MYILLLYRCSNESTSDLIDPIPKKISYSRDIKTNN